MGIAGYNVYRAGVLLNTGGLIQGVTYSDTTIAAQTTYAYSVEAVDLAGNHSALASTPSVTTPRPGVYFQTFNGAFT